MESLATGSGLIRVNGYRLYHETYGTPEKGTLLVLHGGPGISHDYLHPLADLSQFGYRVVLYDQLGCGRSQRPKDTGAYDFRRAVDEVEGLRKALKLGTVHVLGHSYGTQLGTAYALEYPRNLKSLILAGPVLWVPGGERAWTKMIRELPPKAKAFWKRKDPKVEDNVDPRWKEGLKAWEQAHVLRWKVKPLDVLTSDEGFSPTVHKGIMPSYRDYVHSFKPRTFAQALRGIRVPCLITVGRHDFATPAAARGVQRCIPGSKVKVFENSAHDVHWEERSAYVDTVRKFLDGVGK
jgi:proline iminopeptidase